MSLSVARKANYADILAASSPKNHVIIFGDSISEIGTTFTDSDRSFRSEGYITWAKILSNQKFIFSLGDYPTAASDTRPSGDNHGVSGNTTTQMLARVNAVIARVPGYCVVLGGTNDLSASTSAATVIANLQNIYSSLLNAGIKVIAVPILPRDWVAKPVTSGADTAAVARLKQMYINRVIRNECKTRSGMFLADPTMNIADPASSTSDPITNADVYQNATYDGLHPGPIAAYWTGKAIADALQYALVTNRDSFWSIADAYDATNNVTGNLFANGILSGSAASGNPGMAGVFATSWAAIRNSGSLTMTGSKSTITLDNGATYDKQVLAVTSPGGGANTDEVAFRQNVTTGFAVGDTVVAEIEFSKNASTKCTALYLSITATGGSSSGYDNKPFNSTQRYKIPSVAFSGILRTPEFLIPASTTALMCVLGIGLDGSDAASAITVTVARPSLRKIV